MSIKDDIGIPTPEEGAGEQGKLASTGGASIGAGAGAVLGAAAGATAGPAGAVIGAAAGAAVGGMTGFGVTEARALADEDTYWRARHSSQPYAQGGESFEDFERGYRTGYRGYRPGVPFDEREAELQSEYEREHPAEVPGTMQHAMSTRPLRPLSWQDARPAALAAYERMAQLRQMP